MRKFSNQPFFSFVFNQIHKMKVFFVLESEPEEVNDEKKERKKSATEARSHIRRVGDIDDSHHKNQSYLR